MATLYFSVVVAEQVKRNHASAFILEGTPHIVPADGNSWVIYGVIAAQRRAAGNVWLVVSGLAGPATDAAAMMVKDLKLAQDAARSAGATTPLGAEAAALYSLFVANGHGTRDFSGIIRFLRGG